MKNPDERPAEVVFGYPASGSPRLDGESIVVPINERPPVSPTGRTHPVWKRAVQNRAVAPKTTPHSEHGEVVRAEAMWTAPNRTSNATTRPSSDFYRKIATKLAPGCPECAEIVRVLARPDRGVLTYVDLERLPEKVSGDVRARLRKVGSSEDPDLAPENSGLVEPLGAMATLGGMVTSLGVGPEHLRFFFLLGSFLLGWAVTKSISRLVINRRTKKNVFARIVRDNRVSIDLLSADKPIERKLRTAASVIAEIESSDAYASELLDSSGARWNLEEELRSLTLSAARIVRMKVENDDDLEAVVAAETSFAERVDGLIEYHGSILTLSKEVADLAEAARVQGHSEEVAALLRSAFRDSEAARRLREQSADTYAFATGVAETVAILSGSVKAIEATYDHDVEAAK